MMTKFNSGDRVAETMYGEDKGTIVRQCTADDGIEEDAPEQYWWVHWDDLDAELFIHHSELVLLQSGDKQ